MTGAGQSLALPAGLLATLFGPALRVAWAIRRGRAETRPGG